MATRRRTAVPATVEHREGCDSTRVETYETRRPNGEPVTVSRCLDCGGVLVTAATTLAPVTDEGDSTGTTDTPEESS